MAMGGPHVIFLSLPHLRPQDVARMPTLDALRRAGAATSLIPQFPALTWPAQTTLMTGVGPDEHGVIANGFYWRDRGEVEMWTAWNSVVEAPQVWDRLNAEAPGLSSAVWFPLYTKGAKATFGLTPAPIHQPDGTETMWCYSRPDGLYAELLEQFGHFPLHRFWGPGASIEGSRWIADTAAWLFARHRPNFFFIYLPHLDYAAQRSGPDSDEAMTALGELDAVIADFFGAVGAPSEDVRVIVAGEYVITPVKGAILPNRLLREAGLVALKEGDGGLVLSPKESKAWALCDHQVAHVYVQDGLVDAVAAMFRGMDGIEWVGVGEGRGALDHPRSGEVVLLAERDRWFAYPWWFEESEAPRFARTVDIHRKPGYDPVELFVDPTTGGIPLDPGLVRGSHGRGGDDPACRTLLITSWAADLPDIMHQREVAPFVLRALGVRP